MLSILNLFFATAIRPSSGFEFYAYFTDKNDIADKDATYYQDLFSCGVTELIFGGFSVSAAGALQKAFPDDTQLRMAREAADQHNARVSFMLQGVPSINANSSVYSAFFKSANDMFEKYSFDGINFDWEFPGSTAEWEKYRDLMKNTRTNVKRGGRNARVTVAIGGSYGLYKDIDLCGGIDMCLWMGYDNHNDPRGQSNIPWVKSMVNQWINVEKLDPAKFGLGVPLYGENKAGAQVRYTQLVADGANPKGNGSFNGYFFDSQPILQEKIDFAKNQGLGGLMAWVLQSDLPPNDTRSLMYGMKQKLNPGPFLM
ncbi:chitinase [Perkinsus olseni]|uniref:Chitinase n=1 Tax=Perkinsus olseni TaxID=32597 RepID=A0A7J6PH93_PEROL|nr:chitinase [Perkinsus olseni]KAF4700548.1 chitinase [Perkinsus olseni]KAF4759343.1 chitinase [Perkinsus olseni]